LRRFYEHFAGNDQVLVVIEADPDSIASAMAVSRLLWRKVQSVTICPINTMDRPDNLTMIRLLGPNLTPFSGVDPRSYERIVIVDSQPDHHEPMAGLAADVIIDHHPLTGVQAPFVDVRPEYGATATILTEYLRAAKIKPSVKLATALFIAIKVDTNDFKGRTVMEDVRAFQYLFRHTNIHMVRKIEQADLKLEFLKYFRHALENMRRRKTKIFAHLGPVTSPDVCVIIADFFMRISSITWSIVSGTYNRKLIVVFRNDGIRKNAGNVAKHGFGAIGSAGGHKNMARAEVEFNELKAYVDPRNDNRVLRWIIQRTEGRTIKRAAKNIPEAK